MGETNWANETMWTGDNLPIMWGMEYLVARLARG